MNAVLDAPVGARVDAEFVVAAADVLHERVAADDHACGVVAFEAAHRSEPGFEPTVVAFDAVVRVLLGVVERGGHESFDRGPQRRSPVGHDLDRLAMRAERSGEEPACRAGSRARAETYTSMIWPYWSTAR